MPRRSIACVQWFEPRLHGAHSQSETSAAAEIIEVEPRKVAGCVIRGMASLYLSAEAPLKQKTGVAGDQRLAARVPTIPTGDMQLMVEPGRQPLLALPLLSSQTRKLRKSATRLLPLSSVKWTPERLSWPSLHPTMLPPRVERRPSTTNWNPAATLQRRVTGSTNSSGHTKPILRSWSLKSAGSSEMGLSRSFAA